jgi:hypothetical protein
VIAVKRVREDTLGDIDAATAAADTSVVADIDLRAALRGGTEHGEGSRAGA